MQPLLKLEKKLLRRPIFLAILALPAIAQAESEATDDSHYQKKASNSVWEAQEIDPSFYEKPYRISLFNAQHCEDSERL